ncbi:MAG: ABC transporter permease [Trueperaceae bacterium]
MTTETTASAPTRGFWARMRRTSLGRAFADATGLFGLACVTLIVMLAIFAPWITPYTPDGIDVANRLAGPSSEHLMGTDQLGRDLFSRLLFGARIALMVAVPATLVAALVGSLFGLIAGYFGGVADHAIVLFFDVIRSFPSLLLAIALIALTGPSLVMLVTIIAITSMPSYGRLIRAQTIKAREEEYVTASRALGARPPRIMTVHLLPNVVAPLFIQAAMDIPVVITFEAGLSFLGLGVPPPTPSWGSILREGYSYVRLSPWPIVFGSGFLVVATLGFTFFAESLRDAFDVRLKNEDAG